MKVIFWHIYHAWTYVCTDAVVGCHCLRRRELLAAKLTGLWLLNKKLENALSQLWSQPKKIVCKKAYDVTHLAILVALPIVFIPYKIGYSQKNFKYQILNFFNTKMQKLGLHILRSLFQGTSFCQQQMDSQQIYIRHSKTTFNLTERGPII